MAEAGDMGLSEEEALLQQALAMSMNENELTAAVAAPPPAESSKEDDEKVAAVGETRTAEGMELDEDDDAAMQMALQMSMQHDTQEESSKGGGGEQQFQDPSFVNELLGSAEGVDSTDPEIQEALRKAKEKDEESKKE